VTPEELKAALDIAGQRLLEADQADREARASNSETSMRAHAHWKQCNDDAVTLLKVLRDMAGGRGQMTARVPDPNSQWPRLVVHVPGHKVSMKKADAVCRRLLASAKSRVLSADH
jgi:hypothetical protein